MLSTADTTSSASLDRRDRDIPADSKAPELPAVPKPARKRRPPVWLLVLVCIIAVAGAGAWYWWQQRLDALLPPGIAMTNGRLEAEQVEIAAECSGPG